MVSILFIIFTTICGGLINLHFLDGSFWIGGGIGALVGIIIAVLINIIGARVLGDIFEGIAEIFEILS